MQASQNRLLSLRSYHRVLGIDFEVSAMDRQGKELRHDRHTVSLLTDHLVITPKYRGKILHLRDWCEGHLWSSGCYHGSAGHGWEVVEKYISSQNCVGGEKGL
jgi:hypothetical protein